MTREITHYFTHCCNQVNRFANGFKRGIEFKDIYEYDQDLRNIRTESFVHNMGKAFGATVGWLNKIEATCFLALQRDAGVTCCELPSPTSLKQSVSLFKQFNPLVTQKIVEKSLFQNGQLCLDSLSRAGQVLDREGLTRAGRSLEKHGNRTNSIFPKATGNIVSKNKQGQFHLDDILTDPKGVIIRESVSGNIKIYSNDGRGVFFYKDGKFRGFIERQYE